MWKTFAGVLVRISIANLTNGGLSGGYRKYLQRLIPLLAENPRVEEMSVFVPLNGSLHFDTSKVQIIEYSEADARRGFHSVRADIKCLHPDVVFVPTARWIECAPIPTAVMVRNMEPLIVPFSGNSLREGVKNLLRASAANRTCQRSTRVLAVSQFVQDFLLTQWRISPDRVGIVYHGVDIALAASETSKPAHLARIELADPVLFTAGSIRPARGLTDILQALPVLIKVHPNLMVVVAGVPTADAVRHHLYLKDLVRKLGCEQHVMWAEHLNAAEMGWCFGFCDLFIMTSRVEACPNTALEAMSYGCDIVSTQSPPMPEFFRNCALYYDPRNRNDLANKILFALQASPEQKAWRRHAAKVRASDFRWEDTAQQTINQLALAIESRRH